MTNRRILITWTGGPFDGKQECCTVAETGPAERQALAVQDGAGKITSIAWYRLDQVSDDAWHYVFEHAESPEEFRTSVARAQSPTKRPVMPPHFLGHRQATQGGPGSQRE